jgi:hypothetical protein
MAKGKALIPATASIDFTYHTISDMPWESIEAAAQKKFTDEEKLEILHCVDGYDWEYCHLERAPTRKDVEGLRSELIKNCGAIIELAERYPHKQNESEADTVSALQIYFGTEEFCFRDAYETVSRAAQNICDGLRNEVAFDTDALSRTPETAGLEGFLNRVLDEADAVQARGTPDGSFVQQGLEYRRWGVSIGPRARRFPEFASAVLGRKVTEGALRKLWPTLHEHSLRSGTISSQ